MTHPQANLICTRCTNARISISSTSRSSSEITQRANASATPTQVGRQPPAGYWYAGTYPATYGSGSKYRSCYSGQRASSLLRTPSFSSILLPSLPIPSSFPRPSSLLAYVPDCLPHFLTCCLVFLGVFPRVRIVILTQRTAVLHVRLEIHSLYRLYYPAASLFPGGEIQHRSKVSGSFLRWTLAPIIMIGTSTRGPFILRT